MRKHIAMLGALCACYSGCSYAHTEETATIPLPTMNIEEHYNNPLEQDELDIIEKLIHVNQLRLAKQKELRLAMVLFQKQKQEFILGNHSQAHAFTMVTNARQILGDIKEEHLGYLFSPQYLEELVFFSSLAAKSAPVRPETANK